MNRIVKNVLESLERADQFLTEHPLTPANAQITAFIAQLKAVIVMLTGHRNGQDLGLGKYSDGTANKSAAAEALRVQMRPIARVAKTLDVAAFPGVRQTLTMPYGSYQALLARAETFLTTVTPIKAAFVERGLAADFDEVLGDALDVFASALQLQSSGRAQRTEGTAGLGIASAEGRRVVRAIDAILYAVYAAQPEIYTAWKSVSRVERAYSSTATVSEPPAPATPAA